MQEQRLESIATERVSLPEGRFVERLPLLAGGGGVLLLLLSAALGAGEVRHFWHSYLVSSVFFLTLALGGLFFVLIQFVTRAGWSVVVRRVAEQVMGTLPILALLFFPLVVFGTHSLYEWAHPEEVARDPLLQHKQPYLNETFFLIRAVFYLAVWAFLGWWFRRESVRQDSEGGTAITRKLQTASAPALVVFALTVTFAGFDWIMSLNPHWYSTILGVYIFSGMVVGILALMILTIVLLQRAGKLSEVVTTEHLHDLGKLLFGFVVFWAYIAFSQFMLIWYAAIPEETKFYYDRFQSGWIGFSVVLAVGHFVLPFFFLLSREIKRRPLPLLGAAVWLLLMHYLDLYWLVMPSLYPEGARPHLIDLTLILGFTGIFAAAMVLLMRRTALVPLRDPRLKESLSFENM